MQTHIRLNRLCQTRSDEKIEAVAERVHGGLRVDYAPFTASRTDI